MECQEFICKEEALLQVTWPGKEPLKRCIPCGMGLVKLAQHMNWDGVVATPIGEVNGKEIEYCSNPDSRFHSKRWYEGLPCSNCGEEKGITEEEKNEKEETRQD